MNASKVRRTEVNKLIAWLPLPPSSATATLATQDELSDSLFGIRLGPFAEWDLGKRLALNVSGGFVLAPATLDYDFTDTTTPTGGSAVTTRSSTSDTEVLYGAYASCLLNYALPDRWSLCGGAQFQYLTDFEVTTAGHTARLDGEATFFGVLGVRLSF